jgi:peptidoglycan/LPS O-acetylase OafA/YrhL
VSGTRRVLEAIISVVRELVFLRVRNLRRVTTSGRFIPEIDGLRFVAIASVYLYHLNGHLLEKGASFADGSITTRVVALLAHSNNGVQLFFVISGFILGLPFASHFLRGEARVSLRAYFLRRLTRLEPPYVFCMVLLFTIGALSAGESAQGRLPHLVASLLYSHNLVYASGSSINRVAWSLEVEVQFYLLVPAIAVLFAIGDVRWRRGAIIGLILLAVVVRATLISAATPRLDLSIVGQLQYFLVGFLVADLYVCRDWRVSPGRRVWDWVSLVGWPALAILWTRSAAKTWLFPAFAFLLCCAALRGPQSRRVFSNTWLVTVGGMCYTIYLFHYLLISFVGSRALKAPAGSDYAVAYLLEFLLVTPAVLIACSAFFVLVERPCMQPDWPRRLARRFQLPPRARPAV